MKMIYSITTFLLLTNSLFAENYQYSSQTTQEYTYTQTKNEIAVKAVNDPKYGTILTDSYGRTLYMFTPDKNNRSTCYDKCAEEWPPLLVSSGRPVLASGIPGTLSTTDRQDRTVQVSYNGMPLYYYYKDKKPGDAYGQNVNNAWYVINPR